MTTKPPPSIGHILHILPAAAPPVSAGPPKATVLIVDDEPHVISATIRRLHGGPYRAVGATTGREALDIMSRHTIDVVISDERMPGMRGSKLLATVRARHPRTMRIMLTGHAEIGSAIAAINQGEVFRYLLKPLDCDELKSAVNDALRQRDLCGRVNELMDLTRAQSRALASLESEYAGITRVCRDSTGAIVITDMEDAPELDEADEHDRTGS